MSKISVIFGTRPEAIKLAPVILALRDDPRFSCEVCVTAQHREMLDQVLNAFDIKPDVDLHLMEPNQTLASLTARAVEAVDRYLTKARPDLVLVQGDTTTTFCSALVGFYNHIPVGHVEAGLRTGNLDSPWPEEANRVLATRLTTLHFSPTELNKQNLLKERVAPERIFVTGNTVIDALFLARDIIKAKPPAIPGLPDTLVTNGGPRLVLITGHRRESFGPGFESICRAIVELARRFPEAAFVYPVHLNPNVRKPVNQILRGAGAGNIHLIEPLPYLPFVAMMNRAAVILTDSGGVQEEAPSLGKPVLVMRDTTERPEAVLAGTVKLVGTHEGKIVEETSKLLTDKAAYDEMARAHNPYGDGKSTGRILSACADFLHAT
ncbi:MAG TPA: UDP-N-acetylglucosamine 2-epimerase (non-hydrolyzing) [Thermoanaerobaculaceae bacterium]|nr:UDP-N-acetylglucosamine 2-epimerase (non-hydrolyzing) [Thermoanaerobaculaceae bacterium]